MKLKTKPTANQTLRRDLNTEILALERASLEAMTIHAGRIVTIENRQAITRRWIIGLSALCVVLVLGVVLIAIRVFM